MTIPLAEPERPDAHPPTAPRPATVEKWDNEGGAVRPPPWHRDGDRPADLDSDPDMTL